MIVVTMHTREVYYISLEKRSYVCEDMRLHTLISNVLLLELISFLLIVQCALQWCAPYL